MYPAFRLKWDLDLEISGALGCEFRTSKVPGMCVWDLYLGQAGARVLHRNAADPRDRKAGRTLDLCGRPPGPRP